MNILFDLRVLDGEWSGIAAYTLNLLRAVLENKTRHELVLLYGKNSDAAWLEKKLNGIPACKILQTGVSIYSIRNIVLLNRLIHKHRVDLYFTTQYFWPFGMLGCRTVSMIHDIIPLTHPQMLSRSKKTKWKTLFWLSTLLSLKLSHRVIVNSDHTLDIIRGYFGRKYSLNCRKLYPAFPAPACEERDILSAVLAKHGLSGDYILYAGRQDPYKNLVTLIQVMDDIRKTPGRLMLVIAGKIDERYPEALNAVKRLGLENNVKFTGFIPDDELNALYAGCRFAVQPSFSEGFGFTALEPYMFGKITVASKIPAHEEILGGAAVYFDPSDAGSMKNALEKTIAMSCSEIENMVSLGLQRLKICSPADVAAEWDKIVSS